jgi:hypothetical protein
VKPDNPNEPPPFLGTWRRVYWAVAIYLVLIITAMAIFTQAFNNELARLVGARRLHPSDRRVRRLEGPSL